jgi:phenylacetate-CoA ligase
MARVSSRTDDLVIVGGVKISPMQIETVLSGVEGLEPHYQVFVDGVGAVDRVQVQVEVSSSLLTGDVRDLLQTQNQLRQKFEEALGLPIEIKFVEARSLNREGTHRIIDRRKGERRHPAQQ